MIGVRLIVKAYMHFVARRAILTLMQAIAVLEEPGSITFGNKGAVTNVRCWLDVPGVTGEAGL